MHPEIKGKGKMLNLLLTKNKIPIKQCAKQNYFVSTMHLKNVEFSPLFKKKSRKPTKSSQYETKFADKFSINNQNVLLGINFLLSLIHSASK